MNKTVILGVSVSVAVAVIIGKGVHDIVKKKKQNTELLEETE